MTSNQQDDIDFELHFYEKILEHKPDFIEALMVLGDLYTKKGRHIDGLQIDQKLARLRPKDPTVLYNLACSHSLVKNIDEALVVIKKAIEYGYDNIEYLERDDDLHNLRQDSRFREYLLGVKNKKTR